MIIFGTRPRYKTVDSGQFYCPRCRAVRLYERKQARRYFTLYFIPVFPMGDLGEVVECQTCGTMFETAVLTMKPPDRRPDLAALLNSIQARLQDGTPVEYLIRDLTEAGLDLDVARAMVESYLGLARQVCDSCGLTYTAAVAACAVCHQPLTRP